MSKPFILGIDPSGSFKEGKGTTGLALLNPEGQIEDHRVVEAKEYSTQVEYWSAILEVIDLYQGLFPNLALSVEDYVLYATSAKAQINSEMETSKLIGAITIKAYQLGIPMYIRNASQVMQRWSNDILEYKGIIQKKGNRWCDLNNCPINGHSMDALRHAVHCHYFNIKEEDE